MFRVVMFGMAAAAAGLVMGCSYSAPSCTVACAVDEDCPGGQTCGVAGLCTTGDACPCTDGEFLACADATTARHCIGGGTGFEDRSCGVAGCNTDERRCNLCAPDGAYCASATDLGRCDAFGIPTAETAACPADCIEATESTPAHCGVLSPIWLPEACDAPATVASLDFSTNVTIDTGLDPNCTGGIVAQPDGPEICVLRAGTITLGSSVTTVKVVGPRAIAFVADAELNVVGTLDGSANLSTEGPGSFGSSGERRNGTNGGGGAGFVTAGAPGGAGTGAGGAGGAALPPLSRPYFAGGPRGITSGAGGGGLLLIACSGTVRVTGTIAAGGGGGAYGRDSRTVLPGVDIEGGGGGGAGGYIVLQGIDVEITGRLFANGGGGGGGCSTDDCVGDSGDNGGHSTARAYGGVATGAGANGGEGGALAGPPTSGLSSVMGAGGGGGSVGAIQIYVPAGRAPTLSPSLVSPALEPTLTVPTR